MDMGTGKRHRNKSEKDLPAMVEKMVRSALENREDLVLTWEREEDDGRCMMHLFSGTLITPCMRGTLTNRADLGISEGSSHICLTVPESENPAPHK